MPLISEFYGIKIYIHHLDHNCSCFTMRALGFDRNSGFKNYRRAFA